MQENKKTEEREVQLCGYQAEGKVTDFNSCVPEGHTD